MIYGLYLSANGLLTQGMRADTISNNLANVNTHGFKRDFLALRQRLPESVKQGDLGARINRQLLAVGGAVEGDRTHSIFSQGAMQPTGNPLDLAISGKGFFKFTDGKKAFYSRAGDLTLDQDRYLVGANGFRVLSTDGGPMQVGDARNYYFDNTGRLIADGEEIGQVAVVDVDNPGNLHKVGENLYEAIAPVKDSPAEAQVLPAHLEASTISSVREMTSLIEAQRAYEANAKFITIQDDTLGKAITQLAM